VDKNTGFTFRGKEVVLSKTRGRPFTGLKAKGMERGIYPEEMRIKAVTIYAATGNFATTADLCKVPEHTVRYWRKQEWFQVLLMEIREENNEAIDAKFTDIVESAIEQISDRVKNGDFRISKKGEVVRVPVGVRDLSLVAAINIDKRQLLRGLPTSRTEKIEGPNVDKLAVLAEAFEALANKTRPRVIEVTTIEVENAIESSTEERHEEPNQAQPEGNPSNG
jgi:hypothetical protein